MLTQEDVLEFIHLYEQKREIEKESMRIESLYNAKVSKLLKLMNGRNSSVALELNDKAYMIIKDWASGEHTLKVNQATPIRNLPKSIIKDTSE